MFTLLDPLSTVILNYLNYYFYKYYSSGEIKTSHTNARKNYRRTSISKKLNQRFKQLNFKNENQK